MILNIYYLRMYPEIVIIKLFKKIRKYKCKNILLIHKEFLYL